MNNLFKQIFNFIGFSGIGWILDFLVYSIFSLFTADLFLCNCLGAVAGVTFVFVFSVRFIFKNKKNIPIFLKYIIYIVYQIILVSVISGILVHINNIILSFEIFKEYVYLSAIISKILVTPVTMIINFLVLKNLTEKL